MFVVNSHAFNIVDEDTTNEQWLNLYYSPPEDRLYPLQDVFPVADIFIHNVPAFEEEEYCSTYTFPKGSIIFELTSHTHKRGRLFRTWGPGIDTPCSSRGGATCLPEDGDPLFVTTDYADPTRIGFPGDGLVLDGDDPASRRFKYCAIFDNGKTDPEEVKTSTGIGTTCPPAERRCLAGPSQGTLCGGDDSMCPESECSACPLRGGVTSDDEMFLLLGSYFCPEGTGCYEPLMTPAP
ncbi:MAG: hypothetical protein AAF460_03410 [Pseudomonadota bacterium]